MRRILLIALLLCGTAHAELISNPVLFPSATLQAGNCVAATGPNTIATTGSPCGAGAGAGNVTGPTSSTIGDIAVFSNGTGTGLADSNVMAASVAFLGANNDWGGMNTFEVRPVFNGATPWDSLNFTPAQFGAKAGTNVWTGDNTWTGLSTFSSRPLFGLATPWDSANLDPTTFATPGSVATALAPYLLSADAASTYLTQANAASTYLTKTAATSTYMPIAGGTFTGAVTFNLAPTYTGAATAFRGTHITTSNVLRWNVGADGAESGTGNTGSDYHIYGYNDAGVFQGAAITVTRSNLTANFLNRPTFGTATPWDSLNFDPSLYLTIANAAATYTTPAEVNAALATFVTKTFADAHYLGINNGGQPVLGLGPFSNGESGNSTAPSILAVSGGGGGQMGLYPNATAGLAAPGFPDQAINSVVQAGDTAIISDSNSSSALVIGAGAVDSNSPAGIRFNTAGNGSISMGVRPSFAGNTAWDAGNLTPATISSFLTTTTGDARYLKLAGGTVTGQVQFNALPVLNTTLPPVTDSSGDVASAAWTQAVITTRVGTGPFIPLTGVGMPYDITIPYQGTVTPPTIPAGTHVLHYLFTRKVTIPVGFAGSEVECVHTSTGTVSLGIVSTGAAGGIGNVTFSPGTTKATFATIGGPFVFMPGDVLTISTSGNTPDATLGGIFGTIEGAISQ